ncbi:DUF2807 domain-containing protein [Mucilaginibacter hurinus]|uniref:DUF2807 domain-containing protein n=1 Tax=Mucilaginibacter hurinus TaxID=2201324 RepID=A0A367GS82_9SPHI|nr:head GIN domain-containing protein [Mucilaginibacter hurinus]RCH55601.1 DUF2807 domain-containing protein [Mucilaginibacter hurinus]
MKLANIIICTLLLTGYSVFAKANNHFQTRRTTDDRNLKGFNGISVAGPFDVYIKQGSNESVKVDAPDDILKHIVTEVKDGVLKIYLDKQYNSRNWDKNDITVHISAKDLNSVAMSGSGDIFFEGGIKSNSLKLSVTGSGDIEGKVDVQTLESSIAGSGDIKVTGRANSSAVKVTGSGDFDGSGLVTVNTAVKVAGSGDASVNASQKIEASVIGSGDINYTGGATEILKSKTGSGDVTAL